MSEEQRAAGQTASTNLVDGGATDADRAAVAREIGAQLARAREAQRFSLEDVSARLKVASAKLAAIESGNLQTLPDVTFVKGVMRTYARMLHVDIDALLGRFHAQPVQVAQMTRRHEGSINETFDDRKRFGGSGAGGRWIWLVLVAIGLGVGAYFGIDHVKAWLETRNSSAATVAAAEEPAQQQGGDGTVTAALPPVMAGADAPAPSEAAPASEPAASASPAAVVASAPAVVAPAVPAASAAIAATPAAPAAPVSANAPASAPAAAGGELQIRFAADTWYEIRDRSGKVVMGGTAKAGQEVAGGGTAPYKVVIGNVKGVASMSRNGAPVDLHAANRNNVARLTLP